MTRFSFAGQVAVVTGSSRGIGRAYAVEYARRGASVVVNGRSRRAVDETVAHIRAAGGTAVASYDSVATKEGADNIVERTLDHFGTVDVLVNNAGNLRLGDFDQLTVDDLDSTLDSHLRAPYFVTRAAWSIMKEKRYGRVIMTSSGAGLFAMPGQSSYCAAKAGTFGLMKALAAEGRFYGITCNAILPYANTDLLSSSPRPVTQAAMDAESGYTSDNDKAALLERLLPESVASMAVYLTSRECTINGQAFSACGGRYARVFVGVADGWLAEDAAAVTVEMVADHMEEIGDTSRHSVPMWIHEEVGDVAKRISKAEATSA